VARQLWFLRHGEAEPGEHQPDAQRRLTARGEAQSHAAGRALAGLEVGLQLVLTSPRVRAVDTARLAAEALALDPVVHDPLSAGFDRAEALALLEGHDADARLLVVGHEPDFSQVIHDLTGAQVDLKKGGVAAVSVKRGGGELLVLLRPRELALMAGPER
jgi:phosphohistidine phosphatase